METKKVYKTPEYVRRAVDAYIERMKSNPELYKKKKELEKIKMREYRLKKKLEKQEKEKEENHKESGKEIKRKKKVIKCTDSNNNGNIMTMMGASIV